MSHALHGARKAVFRALALHLHGVEVGLYPRGAFFESVAHVFYHRARGGGDEADALRVFGQLLFAGGVEEAFGKQPGFQGVEALLQGADTGLAHAVDEELQRAAPFPHGGVSVQLDLHADAQGRAHHPRAKGVEHALQLRVFVFEGEVQVPAGRGFAGADFADDAVALRAFDFDGAFQACDQLCDGHRHGVSLRLGSLFGEMLGDERGVGVGPVRVVAFGVAEEVAVDVFVVRFLFFVVQLVPDGDVEGARYLLHHFEGELSPRARFLHLLVRELLGGDVHQIVVIQPPRVHDGINALGAVVEFVFGIHNLSLRIFYRRAGQHFPRCKWYAPFLGVSFAVCFKSPRGATLSTVQIVCSAAVRVLRLRLLGWLQRDSSTLMLR